MKQSALKPRRSLGPETLEVTQDWGGRSEKIYESDLARSVFISSLPEYIKLLCDV
jgi:hypothetical protein